MVLFAALIAVVMAQGPHIIADKSIDGDAVQGQNMTIKIRLWNVGSAYVQHRGCAGGGVGGGGCNGTCGSVGAW